MRDQKMKLTNKDLKRIILEEIDKVLNEFHGGIDGKTDNPLLQTKEEEEAPEPTTSTDLGKGFVDAGKKLQKDQDLRKDVKPQEGGVANSIVSDIMSIISKEGNNITLLNKIKKAVNTVLKAEGK
jgi:hypothetical protein